MCSQYLLIPTDTLGEGGRVNRPPLRNWAAMLLERLVPPGPGLVDWQQIEGCMNNAGLIEVYRGDFRSAEEVCKLQLRWAGRLAEKHGVAQVGEFALQPWINLGRLRRMEGDHEAALSHFALAVDVLAGKPIYLGTLTVDAEAWQANEHSGTWIDVLKNVYIVDSVKTYLGAKNLSGAEAFLRRARALIGDEQNLLLDEMELIVLARLDRPGDTAAVLGRDIWSGGSFSKLLRATYRAGLYAAAGGNLEQPRHLVKELVARVLRADNFDNPADQRIVRYLHHLGGLAFQLDLDELAGKIWHLGLRAAHNLDDVPLRLAFLDALLGCNELEDRESLGVERAKLLGECLYVPLLKARGLTADPQALAAPVFTELHNRLRAVAEA